MTLFSALKSVKMERQGLRAGLTVLSLASALSVFGQTAGPSLSPQRETAVAARKVSEAALLQEQELNPTRKITVGEEPYGLAFDGHNILDREP